MRVGFTNKESGAVLDGFGEDLEKIAIVVKVDKDLELLQGIEVFGDTDLGRLSDTYQRKSEFSKT